MAKQTVITLESFVLELSDAEYRKIKAGDGIANNETLKEAILAKVKANLDEGNGIEHIEEL